MAKSKKTSGESAAAGPRFGSHMTIAGGYFRAVEEAAEAGCDCVQLFTKNNNQWAGKPITEAEVARFREELASRGIVEPLSHASYLINLASPDPALRQKSIDAMVVELQRAATLGIACVVVHPGAFTTSSEAEGIAAVIESLHSVLRATAGLETVVLLENTAGQGSCLGWDLAHLEQMLEGVDRDPRVGVCIDTCHAFAAGYDLTDESAFADFASQLEAKIGIGSIRALHLNDSRKGLGSRVDRHEHIGEGAIGLEAFRRLVNHPWLGRIPMYLETEKGERDGESLDVINLRTLRSLVGASHP